MHDERHTLLGRTVRPQRGVALTRDFATCRDPSGRNDRVFDSSGMGPDSGFVCLAYAARGTGDEDFGHLGHVTAQHREGSS
ncbi:hypothetical protein [Streptomyces sp. MP131-18]|uniref:hypothetical protein n=1 Tax=Streptomyces sp. MP131-18 TaxID=1857892 RepID=UPI00097C8654|nr:hypothetical protein [Streptomyces sp. MP131-18]ONK13089.1 hypothetical protein STBA_38510 [Streptomyces sp. MP131-18]